MRPDVDERHVRDAGQQPDEIHIRTDIDVRIDSAVLDVAKRPDRLVKVMRVNAGGCCAVEEAGINVAYPGVAALLLKSRYSAINLGYRNSAKGWKPATIGLNRPKKCQRCLLEPRLRFYEMFE
jgi:hypothetical protein